MVAKVFISYRRDDSAGYTGRVYDRLEREFGREFLFMDVDAIPLGANFIDMLGDEVSKCDVLLAIIGPAWLDPLDENGKRRLDNPNDLVRIEIAAALKRNIPVIPVLLEGAQVPKLVDLPDNLKGLAERNGLAVRHASFHNDIDKLISRLRAVPEQPLTRSQTPGAGKTEWFKDLENALDGRLKFDAAIVEGAPGSWFKPGAGKTEWFKDHENSPEMVVVPSGSFWMGSDASQLAKLIMEYNDNDEELAKEYFDEHKEDFAGEEPEHIVTLDNPIAVSRFAVTFDEWEACVADGGCKQGKRTVDLNGRPSFPELTGKWPVIFVSWNEAKAYAAWLSRKTGKTYRLLSEAEHEYVTRADTVTTYWWGSEITSARANFACYDKENFQPVAVDGFEANPWGLFNVHGNVEEWCEDVWHDNYDGAPSDGSAWIKGGDAGRRVLRGGSWYSKSEFDLRSSARTWGSADSHFSFIGFRLARTL